MYSNKNKTDGFWNSFKQRKDEPHQDKESRSSHSHVFTFLKNNKSYFRLSSSDDDVEEIKGARLNSKRLNSKRLNYKYEHSQLMFQHDGYNCGVFICLFVDAYLRNIHSINEVLINENSLLFARHTILRTILNDQAKEHIKALCESFNVDDQAKEHIKGFNIETEGHLHNLTHNKYGVCSSGDLKGDEDVLKYELSDLETDLKLFSNLLPFYPLDELKSCIDEMNTFITLHNQYSTKDSVPSNSTRNNNVKGSS